MHRGGLRTYSSSRNLSQVRPLAPRRTAALTAAALAAIGGLFAQAASADTWDGGGGDANWSTGANWADNSAPVSPEALIFAGNAQLTNNNDIAAGTLFNGIEFAAGAGSFTLGGNSIILGGDVINNSAVAQTINFATSPFTFNGLTYTQGGLVLDGATSNVSNTAGGTLSLGHVTFGPAPKSTNVSTLNINSGGVSASGLAVQADSASVNVINIATGQTFTVNGNVTLGTPQTVDLDAPDVPVRTNVNFTGGGNFAVNGGNFFVGLGSQNFDSGDRNIARVDMTALNNFTYSTGPTGTGLFGVGWMTRPDGQLRLSNTSNTIVADVVGVGNSGITGTNNSPNNSGTTARLFLGAGTNVINADNINVGAVKGAGSIEWDAAVTTGTLTIAGQNGTARANITVGNQTSATGAGAASTVNLGGGTHSVDILADNIILGRLGGATGGTIGGTMSFDAGTIDVNSLQIAVNASGSAGNATPPGIGSLGSFTMNGGSLTVNNALIIGNDTNAGATGGTQGTFTLNNGTATVNAPITRVVNGGATNDFAVLNVNGGTLDVTGKNIASAATPLTAVNISGGTLANAARIHANAITITNAPTIGGAPVYVLPSAGTLSSPGLTLGAGHGIEGGGATAATVTGDVTAASGGYVDPGAAGVAGAVNFANNLTLNGGSGLKFDLSNSTAAGSNDFVSVGGNLTFGGSVNLNFGGLGTGATAGSTYTLMTYAGTLGGNETNLVPVTDGSRKTFTIVPTATTPGEVKVSVAGSGPLTLTWLGDDSNNWELEGAVTNWDAGGNPEKFFQQDNVVFTGASTNPNPVQLVGQLAPASVTIEATRNYVFAGTGSLTGSGTLTKNGSGTLTVTNANPSFTGATTVNTGVLALGNGGSLGTSPIANGATFRIDRTDASTVANVISGFGTVEHSGTGVTTFSAVNTYQGPTVINAGVVTVDNAAAGNSSLGSLSGNGVTVNSGGTVNFGGAAANNGLNFGQKLFTIAGNGHSGFGAITNRDLVTDPTGALGDTQQFNAIQRVTLAADASVGGPATTTDHSFSSVLGRIDIRAAAPGDAISNTAQLILGEHDLTKIGNGFFGLVNTSVFGTGDIIVSGAGGTFSLEGTTVLQAEGDSRVRVGDGAMFQVWNLDATLAAAGVSGLTNVTRPVIMGGGTPTSSTFLSAGGGTSTIGSPIELRGDMTVRPTNANTNNNNLTLAGNITEDATPRKITKANPGVLALAGTNTFTGGVDINTGAINPAALTTGTGTVRLGGATALHPANVVSFGPAAGFTSVLHTNGNGATVAGLRTTGGAGTSIVENANDTAATLTINNAADHTYAGGIRDGAGATVTGALTVTKTGAGTQTLSGVNTYTGGTNVQAGTLRVARMHENNPVNVTGGKLQVIDSSPTLPSHPSGDNAFVSRPSALTIANNGGAIGARTYNGQLDLGNNDLILDYTGASPIADIEDMVRAGFNGGNWLGNGITSSTANANSNFAVGVADNARLTNKYDGTRLFSGQAVDDTTILVKFTHRIDLDLDGVITTNDATIFNSNYTEGQPAYWSIGDLDYDRVFTTNDATLFNSFYSEALASVPEPATLGVLGIAALGLLGRRRRGA